MNISLIFAVILLAAGINYGESTLHSRKSRLNLRELGDKIKNWVSGSTRRFSNTFGDGFRSRVNGRLNGMRQTLNVFGDRFGRDGDKTNSKPSRFNLKSFVGRLQERLTKAQNRFNTVYNSQVENRIVNRMTNAGDRLSNAAYKLAGIADQLPIKGRTSRKQQPRRGEEKQPQENARHQKHSSRKRNGLANLMPMVNRLMRRTGLNKNFSGQIKRVMNKINRTEHPRIDETRLNELPVGEKTRCVGSANLKSTTCVTQKNRRVRGGQMKSITRKTEYSDYKQ